MVARANSGTPHIPSVICSIILEGAGAWGARAQSILIYRRAWPSILNNACAVTSAPLRAHGAQNRARRTYHVRMPRASRSISIFAIALASDTIFAYAVRILSPYLLAWRHGKNALQRHLRTRKARAMSRAPTGDIALPTPFTAATYHLPAATCRTAQNAAAQTRAPYMARTTRERWHGHVTET